MEEQQQQERVEEVGLALPLAAVLMVASDFTSYQVCAQLRLYFVL